MSQTVLIIGGTRNLGHFAAISRLVAGDRVTVVNRGVTPDELPDGIERLRADRTRPGELRRVLADRAFDLVIDNTTYTGADADEAIAALNGRVGRYVFISTGQVYLVRSGPLAPYTEDDYAGPVIPEPDAESSEHGSWTYGIQKRAAEDRLLAACERDGFPLTTLRLPMVHSERDYYDRVRNCLARLMDGGPLTIPDDPGPPLRHVWVHDVVKVLGCIGAMRGGVGRAYNISQNETVTLDEFLSLLAARLDVALRLVRVPRQWLIADQLLPDCAPFSGRWMSVLDNTRSVRELGFSYTALPVVLDALVADYVAGGAVPPIGYGQRAKELQVVRQLDR